jgi:xanthine dehydrogenase YagR molybdenum-binding subunit
MPPDINRRDILQGAVALGAAGTAAGSAHGQQSSTPVQRESRSMTPYIGTPTSRVDGRTKVTGEARYAADFNSDRLAYGAVVASTVPTGRVKRIDTSYAERVTGVIKVVTHENRPPMAEKNDAYKDDVAPEEGAAYRPLYDGRVMFNGQPVALVLADDWETARFAATLVDVDYETAPHVTDLHAQLSTAYVVEKPEKPRGDAARAYAAAQVRHEADYFIPTEHHNPMELFASTVRWDGQGKVTVHDKTQGVMNVQQYLSKIFAQSVQDVRVLSPYMGGGFGSGLRPQYQVVIAMLGALALQRSVRLVLTRQQMYGLGYRPATIEHLALGAKADGTLEAMTHEATAVTSQFEEFSRNDTGWGGLLYRSPNAKFVHKVVRLDVPTSSDMRAPGAATGVYALECAMDELAVALKLDPVELRLRCYSDRDQNEDLPYTSKQLRECYRQGAEALGWNARNPTPRAMRDGSDLVGWGMATGVWEALQMPVAARIVLTANGHAEVSCAASDIGTGTYTVVAQVAADRLGLPIENITVKLGDSTLPQAPVEGGSWMAASAAHAVAAAADDIRDELLKLAKAAANSPFTTGSTADVALIDGKLASKQDASRAIPISQLMQQAGLDRIEKEKLNKFEEDKSHARNTHSAIFAEVKVDEQLGVIRVTRVVSAVAAGRILNPKTAGSQIMGSVVGGIGMALHEETVHDHAFGRIMNANIAEYHVPVNADVQDIKVIFVDEPDSRINPLGMKGVGEIGIVGVAAAIANAVYHATGKRVRDLPITLDKLQRP